MTQILMKAQSNAKVVLWSVLAICLMTAILSSSPQVAKAKSNKAEVTVTVENYRPDEKKVKYTVYKMGTHKVLGKKTFDFAAAEIEADEPTFTLVVKYNAKGLHEGNGIDVCVHRLAFEKGTYCYYGLAFHVGINPEAIIDISSDFGGGIRDGNGNLGGSVSIEPGSSFPSNGKFFVPETLTVSTGTTVRWTNGDSTLHTVTSGTAESGNSGTEFDSSYLGSEMLFQHNFDSIGTFEYYCTVHPFMTGKVVVK